MRRDPVQEDADAGLVAGIDEGLECIGRAEPAGHREVAGGLVTPGFVQRVFGYRQQLDMRVTHLELLPESEHPLDESRSEEHTSELQSLTNLVCRLLLEKKK